MREKAEDLNSKLAKWLKEQGYPLEMTVARAFTKVGFYIIQSEYYDDPETGKPREIDVSASIQKSMDKFMGRVGFCVECKLAKDKPWIIFTSLERQLADPARIVQRVASSLGHVLLNRVHKREDIQDLPMFRIPERAGYGLTQAFAAERQDVPYSAVMSAAKAAFAQAKRADEAAFMKPVCEVLFPVVVIDGKLFECYLDSGGEVITGEICTGTLVWRSPVIGMPHTIVHIVTLPAIDSFVQEARETSVALLKVCESEQAELSKSISEYRIV